MFSVTFPPENSQYSLQFMNRKPSKGRSGLPFRKAFQFTFSAVQAGGTARTHWPLPRGVLRLIQDATCGIFPAVPSLIHLLASAQDPDISCLRLNCINTSGVVADTL